MVTQYEPWDLLQVVRATIGTDTSTGAQQGSGSGEILDQCGESAIGPLLEAGVFAVKVMTARDRSAQISG